MAARGTESVVVKRPPTPSRLGDPTTGAVVGTLENCIVWPRSSTENADRGIVGMEGFHIWAPAPTAVVPDSSDVVEVRGATYNIEGTPGDWRTKRGRQKGLLFEVGRYA
jgi:hypothetical protein